MIQEKQKRELVLSPDCTRYDPSLPSSQQPACSPVTARSAQPASQFNKQTEEGRIAVS